MNRSEPTILAYRQCTDFRDNISHKQRTGLQCKGGEAKYVSHVDLYSYWTLEKIENILRKCRVDSVSENVRHEYLKILSTLVLMQVVSARPSLHYLNDLITHGNNDATLPWSDAPRGFTDGSNFKLFYQLQWQFCPRPIAEFPYMFDRLLHPCEILSVSQLDPTTDPKFRIDSTQRESALTAFKVNLNDVPKSSSTPLHHTVSYLTPSLGLF